MNEDLFSDEAAVNSQVNESYPPPRRMAFEWFSGLSPEHPTRLFRPRRQPELRLPIQWDQRGLRRAFRSQHVAMRSSSWFVLAVMLLPLLAFLTFLAPTLMNYGSDLPYPWDGVVIIGCFVPLSAFVCTLGIVSALLARLRGAIGFFVCLTGFTLVVCIFTLGALLPHAVSEKPSFWAMILLPAFTLLLLLPYWPLRLAGWTLSQHPVARQPMTIQGMMIATAVIAFAMSLFRFNGPLKEYMGDSFWSFVITVSVFVAILAFAPLPYFLVLRFRSIYLALAIVLSLSAAVAIFPMMIPGFVPMPINKGDLCGMVWAVVAHCTIVSFYLLLFRGMGFRLRKMYSPPVIREEKIEAGL